jgi:hypothetical protein
MELAPRQHSWVNGTGRVAIRAENRGDSMRIYLWACGLVALAFFDSRPASACGGCFGPNGQPTVVTAHRMAMSLSADRTILWDQFEYAGSPEDFVWVLPVRGDQDVVVELADNAFFLGLQQATAITLTGPFRATASVSSGGGFGCGDAAADSLSGEMPMRPPVTVYYEGTVGPYETVTIGSEDPNALLAWMQERDYAVPDGLLPTIEHYVALEMNFVALRLSPGESVTRMQPVRVITPGLNVSFPLRMVSAGIADHVALELFVIAEGRYEAGNFPDGEVNRDAITYDWATQTYDYDELAQAVIALNGGTTWLTEFAAPITDDRVRDYAVDDDAGGFATARADWDRAVEGLGATPFVTRMRADLPASALVDDLVLSASIDGELQGAILVQRDVNWNGGATSARTAPTSTMMAGAPGTAWFIGLVAAGFVYRRLRRKR